MASFSLSPNSTPRQPASLACAVLTSGRGATPGPRGSSRPPAHTAAAPRARGSLAAPWVHSKAWDSASSPPTPAPTGRGQHRPQVRVGRNQGSGRGLFPMEIFMIRSNKMRLQKSQKEEGERVRKVAGNLMDPPTLFQGTETRGRS